MLIGKSKIYGKSKDEIFKSAQSAVFDITRVGANISKLRKNAGMTQTELADSMNVSFQAVSNWERGQSCPDIANLMELAELFGVSVDRILGSERAAELITEISENRPPEMSEEEVKSIAPILNEVQADSVVRTNLIGEEGIDPETLSEVAPYVSDDLITEGAKYAENLADIPANIFPYLSEDFIATLFKDEVDRNGLAGIPSAILPYVDSDDLAEAAHKAVERDGLNSLPSSWLPFLDEDTLGDLAKKMFKKSGIAGIPTSWLPYLDEDYVSEPLEFRG